MMPNTSVRPAASRNSITPSCSPLSVCSTMRMKFMNKKGARRAPFWTPAPLPLHLAVFGVRVLVVGEHRLLDFHHLVRRWRRDRDRLQQVEVLDRVVVVAVGELAARGF